MGGKGVKVKAERPIERLIQLCRDEELVAVTEELAAGVVRSDWILHIF